MFWKLLIKSEDYGYKHIDIYFVDSVPSKRHCSQDFRGIYTILLHKMYEKRLFRGIMWVFVELGDR